MNLLLKKDLVTEASTRVDKQLHSFSRPGIRLIIRGIASGIRGEAVAKFQGR